MKIKEEVKTSIFYVSKKEQKTIYLKSLNNIKEYSIENKKLDNFKEKDFILISNYLEKPEKNIILNSISFLNTLNEFQLFKYLENHFYLFPKIFIGKVIEINN